MTSAHKPVFLVISENQNVAKQVKDILDNKNIQIELSNTQDLDKHKDSKTHYIIFLIQRGFSTQNITSQIINIYDLAKNNQSKLAIIDIYKDQIQDEIVDSTHQLLTQLSTGSPLFRYIITKDIFQNQNPDSTFYLEQLVQQALSKKQIEVSSKGENQLHPLSLKNLMSATLKSLFLERTAGQKLTVIGDPLKDLDLAYLIKDELEKTNQSLNIDTTKNDLPPPSSITNASAKTKALLKWLPTDENEDRLKAKISIIIPQETKPGIFKLESKQKNKTLPININLTKPKKKISINKIEKFDLHLKERKFLILVPIILTLISLVGFTIISSIYMFLLSTSLNKTKSSLDNLNLANTQKVEQEINQAAKYLQAGEDVSRYVLPVYRIVLPKLTTNIYNFSSLLKHSQLTIQSISQSYQLANNLYHDLFTQSGESSSADLSIAIQSRLRTIHQELSQIEIITKNHTFPTYFDKKLQAVNFNQKINTLKNQTTQSLKLLESFSLMLKSPKTQFLALLVQDNNRLKSTGGTIRTVILANIENQKITNIRLLTPGQIDQKMTGQISAPPEIEFLTGQSNLSFANSNTWANFTQTSASINMFLKNSLNFTPDLIIGITTETLKDLLKETGPIQTTGLIFNSGSFQQQLAESDLKHLASQTTTALLEEIVKGMQTQDLLLIKLIRPAINTINQDNLRIWFKDPSKESTIINYSFAGNIFQGSCHPLLTSTNCFADTAHLAENNFSVAPLNFYQSRKLQHQVTIQDQSILHTFNLSYKYSSVPEEINRDYQALYQIYLHPNAQFVSLERNNQVEDIEISKNNSGQLSYFQIPMSHKPEGTTEIKISFQIQNTPSIQNNNPFAYSLQTFHQPGTDIQNTQLIINFPPELSVSSITSQATIGQGKIIYQPLTGSSSNTLFGVQFAK